MMPYSHLFSAIVVTSVLSTSADYNIVFFIGVLAPDLDYTITLFTKGNHRDLLTHSFFLWIVVIIFGLLSGFFILTIFATGALFHLIFDLVDWGLKPFQPFSKVKTNGLLTPNPENTAFKDFIRIYYKSKPVQIIDALLFLASLLFVFVF